MTKVCNTCIPASSRSAGKVRAAGPVGRHASAGTDWKMNAELLTYSRSKVAFAGLTLEGAVVEQDSDLTTAIYGKDIPFRRVLMGNVKPPAAAAPFMAALSMAGHQAAAHEAHEEMQDKK